MRSNIIHILEKEGWKKHLDKWQILGDCSQMPPMRSDNQRFIGILTMRGGNCSYGSGGLLGHVVNFHT